MPKPDFPRPSVGDELLLVTSRAVYEGGTRTFRTEMVRVVVHKMARFKVTVRPVDWDGNEYRLREYDIRTQSGWGGDRYSGGGELHTEETWTHKLRKDAADKYLQESGVSAWGLRGTLRKGAREDTVGFANALRRFEGLEEI